MRADALAVMLRLNHLQFDSEELMFHITDMLYPSSQTIRSVGFRITAEELAGDDRDIRALDLVAIQRFITKFDEIKNLDVHAFIHEQRSKLNATMIKSLFNRIFLLRQLPLKEATVTVSWERIRHKNHSVTKSVRDVLAEQVERDAGMILAWADEYLETKIGAEMAEQMDMADAMSGSKMSKRYMPEETVKAPDLPSWARPTLPKRPRVPRPSKKRKLSVQDDSDSEDDGEDDGA